MKRSIKILVVCCMLLNTLAYSEQITTKEQDANLIKEAYEQYQMWALSRNYYFGTSLKKDRIKALAWQMIYVNSLAKDYPGKDKLLANFSKGLSNRQINRAKQLAVIYRQKYNLNYELKENQMARLLDLDKSNTHVNQHEFQSFNKLLDYLAEQKQYNLMDELKETGQEYIESKRFPIVFGQVSVDGPEPSEYVTSNIKINAHGIFFAHTNDRIIHFSLPGYKPVALKVNDDEKVINYGQIILKPVANKPKTGVVGRITPWPGIEKTNIILRAKTSVENNKKDPWYNPVIPLTVLNSGKFYTTGMAPGRYQLLIDFGKKKVMQEFKLSSGEIKGLSVIKIS
jgi:hypothetical protein